jgi:hypothetical protein
MKGKIRKDKQISRRGFLPILGSSFLVPFLGFSNPISDEQISSEEDKYETLLKPDGTTVKVKVSVLKKSKITKKNISNSSFLNWLNKKI